MESQLKKNDKELESFKQKYDEIVNKINSKQSDFKDAETIGNVGRQNEIDLDLVNLDNQASEVNKKIQSITDESTRLRNEISKLKLNPSTSNEALNLKAKIDLAKNSLKESREEADNLAQNIKKASKLSLSSLISSANKFGSGIKDTLIGKKGISSGIDNVSKKIDSFKSRITKMIGTIAVFRLLRSSLTSLSNGLTSMLKSNKDFANSLNQIKVNLMTAFAPIYNYILPAVNSLMNVLSRITGSIAKFMASVFGQTATQAKKNAKELYNQADAQKAVADAQEGSIASFDKLEVNGDDDKSSGGGSSSSGLDFSKDIQTSTYLDNLLDDLKNKIGNGLWFDAGATIANELNSVISRIDIKGFFDKGKEIATNICNGINGFIAIFNWGQLASKISNGFRGVAGMILTVLQTVDWQSVGKAIGDFFLGIDWLGIGLDIINIFFAGLCSIGDLLIGLLDSIIGVFTNPDAVNKFFEAGVNLFMGLVNGIGSIFSKIGEIFMKIIDFFKALFGIHSPSTVFAEFGKYIMQGLINGISSLINSVVTLFSNLLTSIKNVWKGLSSWFNSTVIQPLKNIFSSAWSTLQNGAKNAYNGVKNIFSSLASFFQNTFQSAWKKVKAVFSTGGKIFDGIKDGIVSAFRNIVNAIIKGINKVVKIPFDGINGALKKIKKVDILGIKPFSWMPTISTPQIPMLAQGAVIPPNAKFLAMLGDQKNGRNLEAPESLIRKIVREESGQEKEVILNATFIVQCETGEEFGRASIKGLRLCEDKDGKVYLVS